jgi:phage portal protein BeeE
MGLFDNIRGLLTKNAQSTHVDFNKAIYNFLGENLVTSLENDDSYINNGYRKNATVYSIINLINKAAQTIPFQVYEVQNQNDLKRYKALTSGEFNTGSIHKSQIIRKNTMVELEGTEIHELLNRPNPAQSYNSFIQVFVCS